MDKIERIIGLTIYTSDGQAYSVKDFINTPFVGHGVELKMIHSMRERL